MTSVELAEARRLINDYGNDWTFWVEPHFKRSPQQFALELIDLIDTQRESFRQIAEEVRCCYDPYECANGVERIALDALALVKP